ncbi:protein NLRC5 isoform X2 [Etheostoma cragini]|uniref:protein NLRC5 isoform X2 n=1 Tax=Etheostoma cragini TaxID=417921 RepID=UPI00155F14B1|nr:protein NLRC5 isoform X2 [Etheostoma cragini]
MDEEAEPDNLNVNSVLAQESSEMLQVLSSQSPAILTKLCQIMPGDARRNIKMDPSGCSSSAVTKHIKAMLEYLRVANHADCCNFLQSMCILCEGIPMRLETRLMSVAGYANNVSENSSPHGTDGKSSAPSEQQLIKRPRIDHWEKYIAAVMSLLRRRWEQLSEHLVREVQPENVWVRLRTANRGRDRPDQTPGSSDKGGRTQEPDGDYGYMDSKVTLETFLQGCAGKVTVLVGQAGSGKTLLMSCLGQQWAHGLGPIPSSYLFVLQEFRQLNILSHPLSLSELLFRHYLPLEGGNDEKRAIVDYLLSNPEQSCWVLDGYEEFSSKLTRQEVQRELLDPEQPLPVADLISGLLNRHLLPGCTVVVTCCARDVMDFEGISDKVGQLQGWDFHEIKEYVGNFFQIKGHSANRAIGVQAADLLLTSRHLLAMSSLPALCNICCICLENLLLKGEDQRRTQTPDETGSERRRKEKEKEEKVVHAEGGRREEGSIGGSYAQSRDQRGVKTRGEDTMMDDTNGRGQIPSTLTQVYLTILGAFLNRDPNTKGGTDEAKTTPQSFVCELSQLAWKGLEESKILFMEEDISQDVLEFSVRTGLLAQVELRREDGIPVNSYRFVHLTIQEFLAALRMMTSADVSDMQLKKRFSLRTRWTTKSDQRTIFTDSLHLYVCGLASPHCTAALVQLASTSGGTGGQSWVQKRQTLVLKLLKNLCHSNTLTGPKILDLCHCVQESQDNQLAKLVVGTRPTLELRNITLLPNDIDALAFVVNSVGDNGIGLDFRACSMELECLDVLPSCQFIHYLSFRSRKYGDKFAEKLSSILPKFTTLKKLEFCGASLTTTGAASLASALQNCPNITEINLNDNNLKDVGIKHIADLFAKPSRLVLVRLGQNSSSLEAVDYLIGKMSSCLKIQHLHADGKKELTITFFQNSDLNHHITKSEPTISLLNQTWSKPKMQKVAKSLARCPALSVLDLSNNCLGNKGLKKVLDYLPCLSNIQEVNVSSNGIGMEGVVMLAGALSSHDNLTQIHISHGDRDQLILKFGPHKRDDQQQLKMFRINNSSLMPSDTNRICGRLVLCSSHFELDLSHSSLPDKAIENLVNILPKMGSLQRLNVSHSITSTAGALMMVRCLNVSQQVTSVEIAPQIESFIHFASVKAEQASCRLTHCNLNGENLQRLLEILQQGPQLSDLDLSSNKLEDEGVKCFLDYLQKLKITSYVNLSNNGLSQQGLLDVASALCTCNSVSGVEVSLGAEERCLIWFTQFEGCVKTLSVRESNLEHDYLVRLAEIVSTCPSLTKLEFKNNLLQSDCIEDLVKLLNSSQRGFSVSIEERWIRSEEAVSLVCRCLELSSNIHTIRVHHNTLHLSLMKSTELTSVSLLDCAVKGYQLASMTSLISRCSSLTKLDFSHNSLGVEGVEFLCSVLPLLPNLTCLSIGSKEACVTVVEKLSDALLRVAGIKCLNLSGHVISDTAAQIMTKMCPRLKSLNLSHCRWSAAAGLQLVTALQLCVSLEGLCLDSLQLNAESSVCLGQALRNIKNIRSLKLNKIVTVMGPSQANGLLDLLAAMEGLTRMEEIELESWRLADRGLEQLTRLLPMWTELRKISLSKNLISDQSGEKLLEALKSCSHLEELHLSSNSLGDLTAARMAQVLPSLTHITVLDISENRIGYEGSVSLSKAIMCMKNLIKIHLTSIGTPELCAVASSLAHCPLLQDVGLGWNNCDDEVAVELARVMPLCPKLKRIDLESNTVSVFGAEALVRALQSCPALQLIRLWRNKVSLSEAQRLSLRDRRLNFSSI